jgi:phosphoglycolate phosphatase-like HAD superfamily hydrolase
MTKLVVFDLDGTLARTNDVDRECYAQALLETLEMEGLSTDWDSYTHVTDESIVQQISLERLGRPLESAESARVQARLVELFGARSAEFGEIPGAGDLVRGLQANGGWAVAVATGSWRCSAEFKIRHTGLPIAELPAAHAEDGPSRESIVSATIERARRYYNVPSFERIVSVGDGLWDVRTARNLGLPFLGIAEEPDASALRAEGASHVLADFGDTAHSLLLLDQVRIPNT